MASRVFIDTNIILEFESLDTWDWTELVGAKPDIVVCSPVFRELQKAKSNNHNDKKRTRARDFLKTIGDIPAGQFLDRGSYRLFIRVDEPTQNTNSHSGISVHTEDDLLIACVNWIVRWNQSGFTDYVLSADRDLRTAVRHSTLRHVNVLPMEPPECYGHVMAAEQTAR